MPLLTILCVTRADNYAIPFLAKMSEHAEFVKAEFVVAGDGASACNTLTRHHFENILSVSSKGYIESVLDFAIRACTGKYILRLDDDEMCSPNMVTWLQQHHFTETDHWKFPRAHLWENTTKYITDAPLWPDHQTRLSTKAKSGGRHMVHAGSPYGGGKLAPCYIEHHKFLTKPLVERRRIAESYDKVQEGYGTGGMKPFSLPEEAYERLVTFPISYADIAAENDARSH